MKRRMEKEVGREAEQDLQVGLDPGEGLEARGRSTKLIVLEIHYQGGKPIRWVLGPIWRQWHKIVSSSAGSPGLMKQWS